MTNAILHSHSFSTSHSICHLYSLTLDYNSSISIDQNIQSILQVSPGFSHSLNIGLTLLEKI